MLKKYFYISGLLFNLLIVTVTTTGFYQISKNSLSLPHTLELIGYKLNSAGIGFLKNVFLTVAEKLDDAPEYLVPISEASVYGAGAEKHRVAIFSATQVKRMVMVTTVEELEKAIREIKSGDHIRLQPGVYRLKRKLKLSQNPNKSVDGFSANIFADNLGDVIIEQDITVAMQLELPNITVNNLVFNGICDNQWQCQHALHITARAENSVIQNNIFKDYDAAIKINGVNGMYPDNGKISRNTIYNTSVRDTKKSVTPIDLVGANNWIISKNYIRDFEKGYGNLASYGVFLKGGSIGGRIEKNLIVCSHKPNNRYSSVGLSLGGGGTDKKLMRNQVQFESSQAVISHNYIVNCSDVGIYINKGKDAVINNNLLFATRGIDVRFKESSANIYNNILSGRIKSRDMGVIKSMAYNFVVARTFLRNSESLSFYYSNARLGDFTSFNNLPDNIMSLPIDFPHQDYCDRHIKTGTSYLGPQAGLTTSCTANI